MLKLLMADQICDTCGNIGFAELIATCSKCKVIREHLYCMRIKTHEVPEDWLCEQCVLDGAKSPDDLGLQGQSRMQRPAKTGKVKFIPTDEAIKLSSGGMKGSSKSHVVSAPQRTSISRKIPASSTPRQFFKALKESQEQCSPKMSAKESGVNKQPLAARLPPIAAETSKKAKVTDVPACTSSLSRHGIPVMNTGKRNALISMNIDHPYLPALDAAWKGGFLFVNTLMAGKFYGGFLAKPPCVLHCKAYEFSLKMPPVLQVKLLTRSDIWDDLFHNDCLNLGDVALYFYPSNNIERSRQNNSGLFELMEREKLLIRSSMDGAELFIFTSRQLDVDSQDVINRLNSECLLFGVFRSTENNPSLFDIHGEYIPAISLVQHVPSVEGACIVSQSECTFSGNRDHDASNIVNKEIDLMSGNDTGKSLTASKDLDATIQQLLLEFGPQQPGISDVNTITKNVKIEYQEPTPISAIISSDFSLSKLKTESLPDTEVEGVVDKKCPETEKWSRMVPTFSLDGSQNRIGLFDRVASARVADKYLQIFNAEIIKEPH